MKMVTRLNGIEPGFFRRDGVLKQFIRRVLFGSRFPA
jgi:hypothetical protein